MSVNQLIIDYIMIYDKRGQILARTSSGYGPWGTGSPRITRH